MGDLESGGSALSALQMLLGSDRDPCANLSAAATPPASCGCTGARMRAMVGARQKSVCQRCWDPPTSPAVFGGLRHVLGECKVPGSPYWHAFSAFIFDIQRFSGTLGTRAAAHDSIFDNVPLHRSIVACFTSKRSRVPCPINKKSLSRESFQIALHTPVACGRLPIPLKRHVIPAFHSLP
jgi:hypothetical protein